MKKELSLLIIISFSVLSIQQAICCSTFCLKDSKNIVFGRSYDWGIGYGYLMTNNRNVKKNRYLPFNETAASWTSKYGSITFNQYGKEYPIGGMNETGLVVEVMLLDDTKYSDQDARAAIDELGWVQYQLDNCATIKEVIESDKNIRISNKTAAKLHFLVTDSTGNTLAVEFINGKTTFHYGNNLPQKCLTNDTYDSSLSFLKNYSGFGGKLAVDYQSHSDDSSLTRFAIVADMLNKYKESPNNSIIDYSFNILDKVKDEEISQFQIVYDIKQKRIYFRSLQSNKIKSIDLNCFNFDCTSQSKMIDINISYKGNICNKFTPYDIKKNKELIIKAYQDTRINYPENTLDKLAEWTDNLTCVSNKKD